MHIKNLQIYIYASLWIPKIEPNAENCKYYLFSVF